MDFFKPGGMNLVEKGADPRPAVCPDPHLDIPLPL